METPVVVSANVAAPAATPTPVPVTKVANRVSDDSPFQAGVSVLLYGNDPRLNEKVEKLFDRLIEIHVNSVSLVFPFYQDRYFSSEVSTYGSTLTDENILSFIRRAHARGFHVLVRPIMDEESLRRDKDEKGDDRWRGSIAPQNKNQWFQSYGDLMLRFATLAQAEGAEVFSIGVEFTSMATTTNAALWSDFCAKIRTVYTGQLTYAMNHGAEKGIPCANDLAFIGVDAFYDHAVADGTEDQLIGSWQSFIPYFEGVKQAYGKPLVFSEVGMRSQAGAFRQPWVWLTNAPVDLEAQRVFYSATCKATKSVVTGYYFWDVDLDPPDNPGADPNFEFLGKPAEEALSNCYAN